MDIPLPGLHEYRLEDQIGFLLRLAHQRHVAIFQARSPFGLTPMQFAAVMKVAEIGVCSQNELGRRTKMDVATIKGVVDRLFEKGLIGFTEDPGDRRRKLVRLSDAAEVAMPELRMFGQRVSELTLEPLSNSERRELLSLIAKLS